ncbi:MAG: ABC transporter substrate-binding protein [Oscillospiraceae bacterium]|jgi:simple sugar transport system substrate-binding protein|nr:ABC transporter substrate-binding protein [Oscillospiraceae bacterium]
MNTKRILFCVLAALCACLLTACAAPDAAPPPAEDTLLLGFSQLGSESGWRIGNTLSIQEAAAEAGVQLMFDNAEQSQEKQIKALRSFIAYQVDVIAFSPIVEEGWEHVLTEAKNAGIPVLLVDRYIKAEDDSLYAGRIGSDFTEEGRKAGRFLIERTQDMAEVRIVELTGTEDSTPMLQRGEGFRGELSGDSRFVLLDSRSGDFLRSKGRECMEYFLETYDDIDVLYSHNDSMTLGAIEAIEEKGLVPGQDIVIISVDGEQQAIDLLKAGKINCVVECTPLFGAQVMELAKQLKAGETIPRVIYTDETVFTEFDQNLDTLTPRGY